MTPCSGELLAECWICRHVESIPRTRLWCQEIVNADDITQSIPQCDDMVQQQTFDLQRYNHWAYAESDVEVEWGSDEDIYLPRWDLYPVVHCPTGLQPFWLMTVRMTGRDDVDLDAYGVFKKTILQYQSEDDPAGYYAFWYQSPAPSGVTWPTQIRIGFHLDAP